MTGDYGREGTWDRRFVWLWGAMAVLLAVAVPFLTFRQWSITAAGGFGLPEAVGVFRRGDRLPPLTFVIRRYVPRWAAFPVINGALFAAAAYWMDRSPAAYGALGALQGWLLNHFDVTYGEA
ncbi:MAG TPA: hypothetical protein VGR13_04165 [Actinomycetota bacterium]|jgi:hypothetical protein|nr:hypothetical protein [Actinomycetota bacterium]